jgi:hypothetical protein
MCFGSKPKLGTIRCLLHSHKDIAYGQDFRVETSAVIPEGKPEVKTVTEHLESLPKECDILHFGCEEQLLELDVPILQAIPSAGHVGELACDHFDDFVKRDFYKLEPDYMSVFKLGN